MRLQIGPTAAVRTLVADSDLRRLITVAVLSMLESTNGAAANVRATVLLMPTKLHLKICPIDLVLDRACGLAAHIKFLAAKNAVFCAAARDRVHAG